MDLTDMYIVFHTIASKDILFMNTCNIFQNRSHIIVVLGVHSDIYKNAYTIS
jgi:hypothetical protein